MKGALGAALGRGGLGAPRTHEGGGNGRKALLAGVLAAMALSGTAGPAVAESESPRPLNATLIFTGIPGQVPGTAVFSGAITAVCTETATVTRVPGQATQVVSRFDCPQGALLSTASVTSTFQLDPVTCLGRQPQSGSFLLSGGTGEFAGATGAGTLSGEGFVIFQRTAEGTCALDQPPLAVLVVLRLTGTASVPDGAAG